MNVILNSTEAALRMKRHPSVEKYQITQKFYIIHVHDISVKICIKNNMHIPSTNYKLFYLYPTKVLPCTY